MLPPPTHLLKLGWADAFRRPVATFVLLPLTSAMAVAGCLVPWLNLPFVLVALGPMVGSLPMIALAVARREPLPAWAPFLGFTRYERFLGFFWVPYLVAIGASIPFLVGLWVDRRISEGEARALVLGLPAALSLALLFYSLHPYVLAPLAAADLDREVPMAGVLELAAERSRGRGAAIGWRLIWLGIAGGAGVFVHWLIALLTAPPAVLAVVHLYLALGPDPGVETPGDPPELPCR